jgi:hypothetical protein
LTVPTFDGIQGASDNVQGYGPLDWGQDWQPKSILVCPPVQFYLVSALNRNSSFNILSLKRCMIF